MSKKWTLVAYEDGDRSCSVTKVVTADRCEMDKNRCLVFGSGYGTDAVRVNKDEWISVQAEGAAVEIVGSRAFGPVKPRAPRRAAPRKPNRVKKVPKGAARG